MPWTTPTVVFLIVAALRGGGGSTLADAAFHESVRRFFAPAAIHAITMSDVPPAKELLPALPVIEPKVNETDVPIADAPKPADATATEAEWRERMASARTKLEQDEILAEAMLGRVNSLANEIAARDDPAQRAELIKQRQRVVAETDRMNKSVEADKLAIAAIEEDARKKNIPPGWIR